MQQSFFPGKPTSAGAAASQAQPGRAAVTFLLCAVYFSFTAAVMNLVTRILDAVRPDGSGQTLGPLLNIVLLALGLLAIARVRVPELRPLSALGLVRRPSAGRELELGAAVGWATGIALVLPGVLLLHMQSVLTLDGFHLGATIASALVVLLFVVARQLVLCGLPFRSLSRATSPLFASVAFAGLAALLTLYSAHGDAGEALMAAMAQMVFGMAADRTRAIWFGGALQFAWGLTITVLFGLPSFLWPVTTGVVTSRMHGPRWLTGNGFGPEAALWAGLVVVGAAVAVWRLTRDYAWHYTFDTIIGAGHPMDVPPPAEHTRMEQAAATSVPLVQIGGFTVAPKASPSQDEQPKPQV